jgi:hypothetical protein
VKYVANPPSLARLSIGAATAEEARAKREAAVVAAVNFILMSKWVRRKEEERRRVKRLEELWLVRTDGAKVEGAGFCRLPSRSRVHTGEKRVNGVRHGLACFFSLERKRVDSRRPHS